MCTFWRHSNAVSKHSYLKAMDGLDVQQFISSQRSRLSKEKARLFEDDR